MIRILMRPTQLSMCVKNVCLSVPENVLFMEYIAINEPNSRTVQGLKKPQQPISNGKRLFQMKNDDTFHDYYYILSFISTMLGNCVRFL